MKGLENINGKKMEEMAQDLSGRQNQINSDIFSSKKKATHFYIPKAG